MSVSDLKANLKFFKVRIEEVQELNPVEPPLLFIILCDCHWVSVLETQKIK